MAAPAKAETSEEKSGDKSDKPNVVAGAIEQGNWLALESNPGPLNKFSARMGLPDNLAFCDIYGLDAELLQFVPQPVLAVMLLFPSSSKIKDYKVKQQQELTAKPQKIREDLFYLHQHDEIGNACGTVAMIHALANNHVLTNLKLKEGPLTKFMTKTAKMDWTQRGWELLKATDIQEGSEAAASDKDDNQTKTPSKDDQVSAHFIAFVRMDKELYELDGRKKFPVLHGATNGGSFLTDVAKVVKEKFMALDPTNVNFNLMALAPKQEM